LIVVERTDHPDGSRRATDDAAKMGLLSERLDHVRQQRDELEARLELSLEQTRGAVNERDGYHQRLLEANEALALSSRRFRLRRALNRARGQVAVVPGRNTGGAVAKDTVREMLTENEQTHTLNSAVAAVAEAARIARRTERICRFSQATHLLSGQSAVALNDGAIAEFVEALRASREPHSRLAWLAFVAATGRYPTETDLRDALRILRHEGAGAVVADCVKKSTTAPTDRAVSPGLDVRLDAVLVDVTHTVGRDLHTGIQRVVRELCSRWFRDEDVLPIAWSIDLGGMAVLSTGERHRMFDWRNFLSKPGEPVTERSPETENGLLLVPWRCRIVVPELSIEPHRCEGYRSLAAAGVGSGLSFVTYDMIPLSSPETMPDGMAQAFANYLSTVRSADFVSSISETSATEYRSFFSATSASRGLRPPDVASHLLPTDLDGATNGDMAALESALGIGTALVVLVVGSHEPRKNHMAVLEAAERLWTQGHWFYLIFMGGGGWRDDDFNDEVHRLSDLARPIVVLKRVSEGQLVAAYHRAQFTVFPSIVEGFGLPILESLRCGTPVITSNYGAMKEAAAGGGAILVDPRDPEDLFLAMERLLLNPAEISELSAQAFARSWKSWEDYALEVWGHLVQPPLKLK
jgi:glycosyltransferase involved in cell wall biosynthesis